MIDRPQDLLYSRRHLWVRKDDNDCLAEVGITEELQELLPEIVSIDVPVIGDEIEIEQPCIHVYYQDGIRHIRAPLSGKIIGVNRDVLSNPQLLHLSFYTNWLFQLEYDEESELEMLLACDEYVNYLESL